MFLFLFESEFLIFQHLRLSGGVGSQRMAGSLEGKLRTIQSGERRPQWEKMRNKSRVHLQTYSTILPSAQVCTLLWPSIPQILFQKREVGWFFSCEDAAQQVLMSSVRVCVCVCVINLKIYLTRQYQTVPDSTRQYQIVPDSTRQYQTVPDSTRQCQTVQDSTWQYMTVRDSIRQEINVMQMNT